ncbi:TetR/AcrR family transcriptional regulator [Chengkuizengella sediminis]|uniref:TetR/AcrR family transcriptional regulator n=1 Tax=Chengkuizengella sediminis TaxID=1885917 RepID=UPI0013899F2A|nr:TetR/AcrR family transcriptional regulator [Chengkuizengella sediminis]NDI36186.1 TetR/AcrR family transcriptional regulator [Chengkuizengella sediminis]
MSEKNNGKLTTKERILKASLKLFSENGYKGATLKKIAQEAGVTEMTVFRIFETKEKIYEEIMGTFKSAIPSIRNYIEKKATFVLEEDLKEISKLFYNQLLDNAQIMMIIFKEKDIKSIITDKSLLELRYLFVHYFDKMKEKGKIREDVDSEILTFTFLTSTLGTFLTRQRFLDVPLPSQDDLIEAMVPILARGIKLES